MTTLRKFRIHTDDAVAALSGAKAPGQSVSSLWVLSQQRYQRVVCQPSPPPDHNRKNTYF